MANLLGGFGSQAYSKLNISSLNGRRKRISEDQRLYCQVEEVCRFLRYACKLENVNLSEKFIQKCDEFNNKFLKTYGVKFSYVDEKDINRKKNFLEDLQCFLNNIEDDCKKIFNEEFQKDYNASWKKVEYDNESD